MADRAMADRAEGGPGCVLSCAVGVFAPAQFTGPHPKRLLARRPKLWARPEAGKRWAERAVGGPTCEQTELWKSELWVGGEL